MKRIVAALLVGIPLWCMTSGAHPWPRAYVVDDRVAALRAEPRLGSPVIKRLRPGRLVAVVSRARDKYGVVWVRVAVTRRTRGWLLERAIARPNDRDSEARLTGLLSMLTGYERLRLARVAIDHFPRLRRTAVSVFNEEASAAAAVVSLRLVSRDDIGQDLAPADAKAFLLSDPAIDRYSRLGVVFDVDPMTRTVTALPAPR